MTPIEERMAALRQRFIDRARDERAGIAEATGDALDRDALRRRAHSISGTAGLFGFDDVGDDARRLEEAVDDDASDADIRALAAILDAKLAALG